MGWAQINGTGQDTTKRLKEGLFSRDAREWCQLIVENLAEVRFHAFWVSTKGKGSRERRQKLREGIYSRSNNKSTTFKRFNGRLDYRIQGQRIMAIAFQIARHDNFFLGVPRLTVGQFGAVIIFHPSLNISQYTCRRKGQRINKAITAFRSELAKSEDLREYMERVRARHKEVLQDILTALCPEPEKVMRSFNQIEAMLQGKDL